MVLRDHDAKDDSGEQHRHKGTQVAQRDAQPIKLRLVPRTVKHNSQPKRGRGHPMATTVDVDLAQGLDLAPRA